MNEEKLDIQQVKGKMEDLEEKKANEPSYKRPKGFIPFNEMSKERHLELSRKGGSRSTFVNLKHGRRSEKFRKVYICPKCGAGLSAQEKLNQDALMAKFAGSRELYAEIKSKLVLMKNIIDSDASDVYSKFAMAKSYVESLTKILDKAEQYEGLTNEPVIVKFEVEDDEEE